MKKPLAIDMEKLRADMVAKVAELSGREFSRKATGGTNPDFYRNFMNDGQDKRLSAEVFFGIVQALGTDPAEYVIGYEPTRNWPSSAVLTSTFAMLLDSVGIDPFEDARAQKLAANFPNALQSIAALHTQQAGESSAQPGEAQRDGDAARSLT